MYQDRVIVFIDILGFKEIIESTIDAKGKQKTKKVRELKKLLSLSKSILREHPEIAKSRVVTRFSDSIVISFKYTEPSQVFYTFLDILHLHIEFLNMGYVIRGGISHGKLYHTKKMIFGPGLVRAYEFESKYAIYPRVIIDSEVFDIGVKNAIEGHSPSREREHLMNLTRQDFDGKYFVEYIESAFAEIDYAEANFPNYLITLKKVITTGLQHSDVRVVQKFVWLKDKYNAFLKQITENKYADRIEGELDDEIVDFYRNLKPL